ncbi:YybH family protein [Chondromyces apiculatus]|uniref:SnoaL-like domain-containing protein n=1 Tax=Chondromyces apiculatus DSM 436 TaxID=1192034 RepID=A0A017T0G0_9BACT|nr:nuclear transport factor 2 family protein [Chondromyces apiculatus]EYF02734.1 Hypothetical protein CAP_6624 [Chondromyces apiculatus DSM 436]
MTAIAEIRELVARFTGAFGAGDMETLRAVFSRDETLLFYGTQVNLHIVGWPGLERAFAHQFAAMQDLRVSVDPDSLVITVLAEGRAACVGTPRLRFQARMGERPFDLPRIRMTAVAERRGEGWVFVQMHWSLTDQEVVIAQEGEAAGEGAG